MRRLVPLGDRAILAQFDDDPTAAAWAFELMRQDWSGVLDVVLAYNSVGVHADPEVVDLGALHRRLEGVSAGPSSRPVGKLVKIPVLYDGEDLAEVAASLGLSTEAVVAAHTGKDYRVYAIGFSPGFPYAGDLPDSLRGLPRRPSPRTRVPAGSVAIVGRQTAVYPEPTPGGWHLIGRTPLKIVDIQTETFPIMAGDQLRFIPIDRREFDAREGGWLRW